MNLKQKKTEFRDRVRELNSEFDYLAYLTYSKVIVDKIGSLKEFKEAKTLLLFSSLMDEPHLKDLIYLALEMGKKVALPYTLKGGKLKFLQIDNEWEKNSTINGWGITEPNENIYKPIELNKKENSLIVVPAMAYSKKRERLGRGKGFYDRFLAKNRFLFSVGICFDHQLFDSLPTGMLDTNVNMVVTPSTII
ncbi:MAG: 5-formyltetrahydrofolate cyclo-ligase [Sphaerochaetaceae bacterium]|jgi:5-formyltetrahydrofolate cyclo-ligase